MVSQPCGGTTLDRQGVFSWTGVSGAYQYEFQIAASANFLSPANSGQDDYTTRNTRVTVFKSLPDGTYYWRVRAQNNGGSSSSAWSATCTFSLSWTDAATLNSPADTATVSYPTPLVLNWSAVTGAKQYKLTVSQSPDLSNPVQAGGNTFPVTTGATSYSPPVRLAEGTYYWGVTPIDNQGNLGTPSAVHSFTWSWPSTSTILSETDVDPNAQVTDPQFSWTAIPGANNYEIEINSDANFSSSGKVCCSDTIIGTTFSPTNLLPADTYYWRIRAKDPNANYGAWVVSPSTFTVDYDDNGISSLSVVDSTDSPLGGVPVSTDTPIVSWDPTPGAASYLVDVVPYTTSCQWSAGMPSAWHDETAATAWTPLGSGYTASNPWPNSGHPNVTTDGSTLVNGSSYCVRVRAERANDTKNNQVYGAYTYLNGNNHPAFTYTGPPTGGACTQPCDPTSNIGAGDYILPAATGNTRLPLFTWNPIAGDGSYYVIVATDPQFQHVFDEAFTQIPAYAPRNSSSPVNYLDTNTQYYWAVLPAPGADGTGVSGDPTAAGGSYPQTFDFHSVAPSEVTPTASQTISTQPTFQWTPVEGALQYRLEVSTDPGFGTFVGGTPVLTNSTSYTGTNFPASSHLYWQVQAIDKNGNGLSWSTPQVFQKTLAVPTFTGNGTDYQDPTTPDGIPTFQWDVMPGAIAYNLTIVNGSSTTNVNNLQTTAYVPTGLRGTGAFTWSVNAVYPTTSGNVTSGSGATQSFTRTILPPGGLTGSVNGQHQVVLSWNPKAAAGSYAVRVGTNNQFTGSSVFDNPFTRPESAFYAPDLTQTQYAEGGSLYWEVAVVDADGNQGGWSAPQLLTLPTTIHGSSSTGAVPHGSTATIKVYAKTGTNAAISGVLVKAAGAGITAASHTTSSGGYVTFKVKPTKKGTITFTLSKTGCISTTVKVTSY
ncbi:MAG: hypothetical protein ACTHNU_06045 [Gaiellales bacterium]